MLLKLITVILSLVLVHRTIITYRNLYDQACVQVEGIVPMDMRAIGN